MDQESTLYIIRIMAIVICIHLLGISAVAGAAFMKSPPIAADILRTFIGTGNLTRLVMSGAILAIIFVLRMMDKISGEAAVGAIGTIAGYILGQSQHGPRRNEGHENDKTQNGPLS